MILAYQNYETRNKFNEINSNLEYALFELRNKKEAIEANKYAKSSKHYGFFNIFQK